MQKVNEKTSNAVVHRNTWIKGKGAFVFAFFNFSHVGVSEKEKGPYREKYQEMVFGQTRHN